MYRIRTLNSKAIGHSFASIRWQARALGEKGTDSHNNDPQSVRR